MTPRLCRLCHERPVPASRLRWSDYRCSRCRRASPAYRASRVKYDASPARMARQRVKGAKRASKRIFVGERYHSMAATAEQARAINLHIKERLRESVA